MPSLYPTFKLPKMALRQRKPTEKTYKQAPMFDYDTGDFVRDGANRIVMADGKEAYMEWCLKQCVTERGTKLAYSDKIGVEIVKATTGASDPAAVQSDIERTITEAIMVNPATEYVRDFDFSWDGGDSLAISFVVKGKEWDEETLQVVY